MITLFWKNLKCLWRHDIDADLEHLESNIQDLERDLNHIYYEVGKLQEAGGDRISDFFPKTDLQRSKQTVDEPKWTSELMLFKGKPDILQSDPIDLFKADRQKIVSMRAMNFAFRNHIKTVESLLTWTPARILAEYDLGVLTLGYIQHCLAKHGLKLRED